MVHKFILPIVIGLVGTQAQAKLCPEWSSPKTIGEVDFSVLPETSGLAVSAQHPGRLYHINDRGNETTIFVSNLKGTIEQRINVTGLPPETADTESLGYGPCGSKTCLFIGDIGDNKKSRSTINLAWFEEKASFDSSVSLKGSVALKYPDGSHNSEGMFVHPNGDVFFFTKELAAKTPGKKGKKHKGGKASSEDVAIAPSKVYRLPAAAIVKGSGTITLEKVGEIDVPAMVGKGPEDDKVVTGATVSQDGRILLLTYGAVVEIAWDPSKKLKPTSKMKKGTDYNVIRMSLPHQEAAEFLPDGSGFIVTSENRQNQAPIVEVKCGAGSKSI
ncbi:MAG TPA: hypothetical protein VM432_09995 [Bdellovibrionales bacterium]|nr:hypothetical protein [Bdellovibrionales bacterium]